MRGQEGAVALESVLVLPLVVLLAAAVLATSSVVVDHLTATRAARAAARTVALTGEPGTAATVVGSMQPGATTTVSVQRGVAHVTVRLRVVIVGVPYAVDATAAAPLEPGAGR